jgi:hypothetical protein
MISSHDHGHLQRIALDDRSASYSLQSSASKSDVSPTANNDIQTGVHFTTVEVQPHWVGAGPFRNARLKPSACFSGDDPSWQWTSVSHNDASLNNGVVLCRYTGERQIEGRILRAPSKCPASKRRSVDR